MTNEILLLQKPIEICEFTVGDIVRRRGRYWAFNAQFERGYVPIRIHSDLLDVDPQPGQWGVMVGQRHKTGFVQVDGESGFCQVLDASRQPIERLRSIHQANLFVNEFLGNAVQNHMQQLVI